MGKLQNIYGCVTFTLDKLDGIVETYFEPMITEKIADLQNW